MRYDEQACEPKKTTPIERKMAEVAESVDMLAKIAAELIRKIEPVTLAIPDQTPEPSCPRQSQSTMSHWLDDIRERVCRVSDNIQSAANRIEL